MSKYDSLKILKKTRARVIHFCDKCGNPINSGDDYYKEHIDDKFLHTSHLKKFCNQCFDAQYGIDSPEYNSVKGIKV